MTTLVQRFPYDTNMNGILLISCILMCGVIGTVDSGRDGHAGFTLNLFRSTNTGVVSVQCTCEQLPKDTRKILSVNLKRYVSASKYLPVASLYPDGKLKYNIMPSMCLFITGGSHLD